MGVFAPLTGAIGAMQAMEAIKLVAGIGTSLSGRLQVYDALNAEWRTVKVAKDSACGGVRQELVRDTRGEHGHDPESGSRRCGA